MPNKESPATPAPWACTYKPGLTGRLLGIAFGSAPTYELAQPLKQKAFRRLVLNSVMPNMESPATPAPRACTYKPGLTAMLFT
ncbi:hypothetical protein D3879_01475 [Pseudomonas cavernicola]|uniref:Uncharacterized protein n=1 Tax=Pseudomonas cavernicola TaxID=2320866 RepID=A0A418XHX2_9PSED|nr:hypothetical protein D3879_01475 [Pseudomonas cavernicola]